MLVKHFSQEITISAVVGENSDIALFNLLKKSLMLKRLLMLILDGVGPADNRPFTN